MPRDREELVEDAAKALIDADPTMRGHHPEHVAIKAKTVRTVLAALEAAGCVVVPKQATEEMLDEPRMRLWDHEPQSPKSWDGIYRAMCGASPYRPEERDG